MSEIQNVPEDNESSLGLGLATVTADSQLRLLQAVLDRKVMTAKAYPRDITKFKEKVTNLLKIDKKTAAAAEYAKPVGGKPVMGPSVRLAEIMLISWPNLEINVGMPEVSATNVVVQGFAWDLETNSTIPAMASTSIVGKNGRFPNHVVENLILATAAKCRRNAILGAIPRAYTNEFLAIARKIAAGEEKPLNNRRGEMIEFFQKTYKVSAEQLFKFLDIPGSDDMTEEHLGDLRAIATTIKDGEAVVGDFFEVPDESEGKTSAILNKYQSRKDERAAARQGAGSAGEALPLFTTSASGTSGFVSAAGGLFGGESKPAAPAASAAQDDKSIFLGLWKEYLELGGLVEEILQGDAVDENELVTKLNKPALAKRIRTIQSKITALRSNK